MEGVVGATPATTDGSAYARALVEPMDVAVVACDTEGRLTMCNRLARELFCADERVGEPVEQWASSVDVYDVDGMTALSERLPLGRALREGAVRDVELIVAPRDVEVIVAPRDAAPRRVLAHAGTVRAADGTPMGAVAVLHDVTAQRQDSALLRTLCGELEEANADLTRSVAELEAFAGVVSHDLKTPLGTVGGYLQLLSYLDAEGRMSEDYDELVAGMAEGVLSMRTLIDDLLEFATAPGARLQPCGVDLDALVRDVVATHRQRSRLNNAGELRPVITVDQLPSVFADRAMLGRVMDNLIDNAIKYTLPARAPQVHVSAVLDAAGWVRVEVADRGIGIPEGRHDAVFAGFHRAHNDHGYPGSGLGLAFCRRIVQRHGGLIGARPNPGGGTRFWLTLPAGPPGRNLAS